MERVEAMSRTLPGWEPTEGRRCECNEPRCLFGMEHVRCRGADLSHPGEEIVRLRGKVLSGVWQEFTFSRGAFVFASALTEDSVPATTSEAGSCRNRNFAKDWRVRTYGDVP